MDDPNLNDGKGPPPQSVADFLNALARSLDEILNGKGVLTDKSKRKNGFILLIFPYNEHEGRCNYVSNGARREDVIKMFETQIERFKERAGSPAQ